MEPHKQPGDPRPSDQRYVLRIVGAELSVPASTQGTIVFVVLAICLLAVIVVLALTIGHTALQATRLLP
jgi:hypothetical protein